MKKLTTLAIITLLLTGCTSNNEQSSNSTSDTTNITSNQPINFSEYETQNNDNDSIESLDQILLSVPFTSQAPHANWDDPYQEACEEASFIMAYDYYQGITSYTKEEADRKILEIIKYQEQNHYSEDITLAELQAIAKDLYQVESTVLEEEDINVDKFKQILNQKHPIIIPAAGQKLGNPNFSGDGPPFHMLVIIGYNDATQMFITNDPGTRNGANYEYSYQTILSSIHDWNGSKDSIQEGTPRAMILTTLK